MKLAICNETFVDWPFEKAFRFARDLGYTGIEIAPFTMGQSVYEISSSQRATVRQQATDAGLEVIGLHWLLAKTEGFYLTTPDAETRKRTAQYLVELAKMCRDLGGRVMVLGSPMQRNLLPGVSHAQAMEFAANCIGQATKGFVDNDVVLAIEPLGPAEGDFLNTAALGAELCQRIDSPNVRLHLDVKAMSSEATPIAEIIREQHVLLEHFHANDANKRGPGMGDIDFVPILQTLKDVGYAGWVSVEVFDYTPGVERLATESIEYLKCCLSKLK